MGTAASASNEMPVQEPVIARPVASMDRLSGSRVPSVAQSTPQLPRQQPVSSGQHSLPMSSNQPRPTLGPTEVMRPISSMERSAPQEKPALIRPVSSQGMPGSHERPVLNRQPLSNTRILSQPSTPSVNRPMYVSPSSTLSNEAAPSTQRSSSIGQAQRPKQTPTLLRKQGALPSDF